MSSTSYIAKIFIGTALFIAVFAAAASPIFAGKGKNAKSKQIKLWQQVDVNSLQLRREIAAVEGKYRIFQVNQSALKDILSNAPLEFTEAAQDEAIVFEAPTPEGKIIRFRLEESPVLAPEVAAQFPTWKTYSGQGIDDPTMIARFDLNANGFHGYVLTKDGTFLIDPVSRADRRNYLVYYKGALNENNPAFMCDFKGDGFDKANFDSPDAPTAFNNGTTLRNFKLAVSATKEYTTFFGSQANAFSAIQTTVNRMIAIYRRDLAVTFTLVSDTRTVFTNGNDGGFPAASDPNVADASLTRNQTVLDTTYGSGNYDIGHALSKTPNPNGLAASPSLCDTSAKAQGFTGAPTPQNDGFDVDYVAHEIGHQFGMSHTFNNDADGSCSTRAADSAYEPASGVTIMGYGGICAPRNLSANSIEYFNLRSFDQALIYLQNDVPNNYPGCGTNTATGNAVPTVTVPAASYNIPKQTPFTLTANASDANGDALTFLWEQFNLGAATRAGGAIDTDEDGTARPIFRAYNASTSGSRTFPSLHYILNNANTPPLTFQGTLPFAPTSGSTNGYVCANGEDCVTGERLPSINRTMNFRVTVRDNRAGGGGVRDAGVSVVVNAAAGPFQVTTQNQAQAFAPQAAWQAGTTQTVTWDVAGTTANNINAANVNILLSTDGGLTFPITLKASTPNDGLENITVPNINATRARIKVEAVGSIFFDINNADFAIVGPTSSLVSVSGKVVVNGRGLSGARVELTDSNGATRTAITGAFGNFTFNDVRSGSTYVVSVSSKRFDFAPQIISVNGNLSGLLFTNQP